MAPRTPSSKGPKAKTATSHARAPQQVRIIGGQYKRTPLPVVDAEGLRPTSDRVRETVFNWLGQDLTGWRCLDAFAGSGALGFEAASRGAAEVVLLERDRDLARSLEQTKLRLSAATVHVVAADALAWLARAERDRFELVFIDPPFDAGLFDPAVIAAAPLVVAGGFVYLEAGRAFADADAARWGLKLHRHGRAGAVHFHLLQRDEGR